MNIKTLKVSDSVYLSITPKISASPSKMLLAKQPLGNYFNWRQFTELIHI